MLMLFAFYGLSLFYFEIIYHFTTFGLVGFNPMLMIPAILVIAAFETLLSGCFRKRGANLAVVWVLLSVNFLLFAVQSVYYKIFTRPLMISVAVTTGGDALSDFGLVALDGICRSLIPLLFMVVPFGVFAFLAHKEIFLLKKYRNIARLKALLLAFLGISLTAVILIIAYFTDSSFYEEYQELYAPEEIAQTYGNLPLYERQLLGDLLPKKEEVWEGGFPLADGNKETQMPDDDTSGNGDGSSGTVSGSSGEDSTECLDPVRSENIIDTSPNVLNIDFDALTENGNNDIDELAEIMQVMTPSNKNEYTGMFEGYNLIYITAEGFSPYAVSEELTPTLYKLVNNGVIADDYYVPLWATSTSDGEYVNLMGQIPDGQHSFRRSADNTYPYSLPAYFASEGVKSYAYHNNSLSYYDRNLTHPNLGYDFKAAKLGSCSSLEYGDQIFEMEHPDWWPASDYEMMVSTIPEFIGEDRFHVYYMTVSGHAVYTWKGNRMASINKDIVSGLDCSSQMKAYIACNYELEKAMTYLVEQLEAAGKLEETVIVLSADHYPYGLDNAEQTLEEFTGTQMSSLDVQKNCLVLWNSEMENIIVDKPCSSLDLLPTVLNLFGFDYDSRLFAGRDMLSDSPSLVVFSNRSFITDDVIYDASTKTATSRTGREVSSEYIEDMKAYVRLCFKYSAGILNKGFDEAVYEAQVKE